MSAQKRKEVLEKFSKGGPRKTVDSDGDTESDSDDPGRKKRRFIVKSKGKGRAKVDSSPVVMLISLKVRGFKEILVSH